MLFPDIARDNRNFKLRRCCMKKGILSMAVFLIAAMMVFGLVSQSYASEQVTSAGCVLLFPYYDVRSVADGGLDVTDNYYSIINHSAYWVQSHVRIRTGDCSVELLDFDILQSPKDNFVFDIFPDGGITFASCDTNTLLDSGFILNYDANGDGIDDCFLLSSATFPAMLSLITTCGDCATGGTITTAEAEELVKKGYVEVIEEGLILPKTTDKTLCLTPTLPPVEIPGRTLRALYDTACTADIWAPVKELEGRQYFVQVDTSVSPVIVKRLAQTNAAVVDFDTDHGLYLHEDNYTAEMAVIECNSPDGSENCYAYAAPEVPDGVGATADGANDMNWCFYLDTIGTDAVINKFGAGATFGPTLADIYNSWPGGRDGSLDGTESNIENTIYYAQLNDLSEYWYTNADYEQKQWVDSHYFYAPSPGPYDIMTAFAFTFPFKHFIGENETIQAVEIYDNMENTTIIEIGKFISPGLPTPATYSEEAELFKLMPPFNEGWIRFAVTASNSTAACVDLNDGATCDVEAYGADWSTYSETNYIPGYLGLVFTTGSENLGVSPFIYNDDYYDYDYNGQWGDDR
jgi:hypothetical protein